MMNEPGSSKDKKCPVEIIPAEKKLVYLDRKIFAQIISLIPTGSLTTQEAIYELWAKRKGGDRCELNPDGILPCDKRQLDDSSDVQRVDFITEIKSYRSDDTEYLIPYWRIISPTGTLVDFGRYCDKETQKMMLEQEGHVIEQPNPSRRLYRVQNYKEALFDLDKLIINE